jgi:hypothetical protein
MEEELERELTSRSLNPLNTSNYIAVCLLSCEWPLPQYKGKHGQIGDMLVQSQVNTRASLQDSQEQLSELSSSKSANTLSDSLLTSSILTFGNTLTPQTVA